MNHTTKEVKKVLTYRWLVFFLLAFANFLVFFYRSAVSVMKADLAATFPMTATSFSLLSSMYFYPYVIMQIPTGIMVDTIGVRKTISFGCVITTIGAVVFSIAPNFVIACIGRVLIGIGVSGPIVCLQKNVTQWFFEKERGTISCMGSLAGSLGSVASQAPLVFLISVLSWRNTFLVLAGVSSILAILSYRFIRNSPSEMDLPSIDEIEGKPYRDPKEKPRVNVLSAIWRVLKNKRNWPLIIGFSIHMGTHSAFAGTWAVSYVQDVFHYDIKAASMYTTLLLAGMAVGTFSIGFISAALKSRKIPLIGLAVIAVSGWSFVLFGNDILIRTGLLPLVLFLIGFSMCSISLCFSVIREFNNPAEVGISVSFVNTIGMLTGSIFPTIVGAIIDRVSNALSGAALYRMAFMFIFILQIVCLICMCLLKETRCKNIYKT